MDNQGARVVIASHLGRPEAADRVESALRDWFASLPGRGPRFEPELYVLDEAEDLEPR